MASASTSTSTILNFNPTNFYYVKAPLMTLANTPSSGLTISSSTDYNMTNIAVSGAPSDPNSLYLQPDLSYAFYSANTLSTISTNSSDQNTIGDVCNHINTSFTSDGIQGDQYYNQALCENYNLAQQIQNINVDSLGASVLYADSKSQYSRELLMTVNLCVGIVGSFTFIYFNR